MKVAMMEVEGFEELQRYGPIRRHLVDSWPEPKKPRMTELRRAK